MANSKDIAGFLVILHPPELANRIPFFYGNNVVGRSETKATLVIKEISISQKHAALYAAPGKITITDIGSKNGTKINGEANLIQQGKQVSVDDSMVIYFADVRCRIEVTPAQPQISNNLKKTQLMQSINEQQKPNPAEKEQYRDNFEIKQQMATKDEFSKPNIKDDFNIDQGFDPIKTKDLKPNKKKETKKELKNIEIKPNQIKQNQELKNKPKQMGKKDKKEQRKEDKKQSIQQQSVQHERLQIKEANLKVNLQKKEESYQETSINLRQVNSVESKLEVNSSKNIKPTKKQIKKKSPPRSPSKRKSPPKNQDKKKSASNPKIDKKSKQSSSHPKAKSSKLKEEQQIPKKNPRKSKQKQDDNKQQKNKKKHKDAKKSPSPKRQEVISKQKKPKGRLSKNKNRNSNLQEPESKQVKRQVEENTTKKKFSRKRKLSDPPSEDIKLRNSEIVMQTRRNYVGRRILCSNFYPQFNRKFFFFVQNPYEEFDYLVMKDYKRTFKALLAICRGVPIVKFHWVQQSELLEKILKYNYYIFKDLDYIYEAIEKTAEGFRVFEGYQFYLASYEYHMKEQQIEALVDATGGKIVTKLNKELSKSKKNNCIALVRNHSEDKRQQLSDEVKQAKKQGFQMIQTIEFLLDSCEKQSIDWSSNDVSKLRS